jgi:predicted Fe-Mo cluster-binding NifX family protein
MPEKSYSFCTTQFKPVILLVVILAVAVVGWTVYGENVTPHGAGAGLMGRPGAMRTATAPPVRPGEPAPHPDWGRCTRCHDIIGAKQAATAISVATAPPIRQGKPAPHPDWGRCTKCHDFIGRTAKPTPAAATMARVAPPIGIWLRPMTPAIADRIGLDNAVGVIVSGVHDPSPAQEAGLQVGDIIMRVDNQKVESLNEALALLAAKGVNDTVKLLVSRGTRERKIFVPIGDASKGSQVAANRPTPTPGNAPRSPGLVAVAATAGDMNAQVAPAFSSAPFFIIYDPLKNSLHQVANSGQGKLTAGQQTASLLIGSGVDAVIVGDMGPGSYRTLRASGVRVYTGAFGSVQPVLVQYRAGQLTQSDGIVRRAAAPTIRPMAGGLHRIAVAAEGPTLNARVASHLSLAPYLIIYDFGNGQYQAVAKDPVVGSGPGAIQITHLIVDQGASSVVAGNISPGMVQSLSKLGVFPFSGVSGGVGRAIDLFQKGQLQASTLPQPGGGTGGGMGGGAGRGTGRGTGRGLTL